MIHRLCIILGFCLFLCSPSFAMTCVSSGSTITCSQDVEFRVSTLENGSALTTVELFANSDYSFESSRQNSSFLKNVISSKTKSMYVIISIIGVAFLLVSVYFSLTGKKGSRGADKGHTQKSE